MTTTRLNWALLVSVVLHTALLASFAAGEGGGGGMTAPTRRLTVRLTPPKRFALPSRLPAASRQAATQSMTGGPGGDSSRGLPAPLTPIAPEYPEAALALGIPGRVEILAQVDEAGRVESAVVVKTSLDGVFDRSALEAVRETRFAPGTVNGKPTKGVYRAVVLYRPK
ncbi:MAG TPA: energy transducer TonB [Rhodocyclaceae bacterium]|nr:energy transducer TonB [Rhodocyclaceae bacterium]